MRARVTTPAHKSALPCILLGVVGECRKENNVGGRQESMVLGRPRCRKSVKNIVKLEQRKVFKWNWVRCRDGNRQMKNREGKLGSL